MREYLFRAKLVKNGEWTYGNLRVMSDDTYIITPDETVVGEYGKVYSESVGQYIGLTDKNGRKIFEGDIVKDCSKKEWLNSNEYYSPIKEVIFDEEFCGYLPFADDDFYECIFSKDAEVVGNIYDNPELLEKE